MGRPSKLSPDRWVELERRLNLGESAAVLSREFGVSQSVISNRFSKVSIEVRKTAELIVAGRVALAELPVVKQYQVLNLADRLQSIAESVTSAVELSAKTGHRMHALANTEACRVDDSNPLGDMETLKGVAVLTKIANEALAPALSLIASSKDRMTAYELEQQQGGVKRVRTLAEFYGEGVGA